MIKYILLGILSLIVFYGLSRLFWKAGIDQLDKALNNKFDNYKTKFKENGTEEKK